MRLQDKRSITAQLEEEQRKVEEVRRKPPPPRELNEDGLDASAEELLFLKERLVAALEELQKVSDAEGQNEKRWVQGGANPN